MKFGFKIVFDKDIPFSPELQEFLKEKLEHFSSKDSYKVGYANSSSFYKRGIFGLPLNEEFKIASKDVKYTFKRLVRNRRIFGVVPVDQLIGVNGPINLNQCMCAQHMGGQRVTLKKPYSEEDYITFATVGEIKG